MTFFVMLRTQSGDITPMMGGEQGDELVLFDNKHEAVTAAEENILGKHLGALVFDTDTEGESV